MQVFLGFHGGSAVKNLPAIQETLGWEDPLEKGMATYSVFLPGESHGQRSLVGYSPWSHKRVRQDLLTKQQQITFFESDSVVGHISQV